MHLPALQVRLKTGAIVDASIIDPRSSSMNCRGETHIPVVPVGCGRLLS